MKHALRHCWTAPGLGVALFWCAAASAQTALDLLPDLRVDPVPLTDNRIDTETLPGRRLLRLATSTPNVGAGALEVRGSTVLSGDRQEVLQRIYRTDGSFWDRPAGTSAYHAAHDHTHFDGWAIYRLRAVGPDGSVGNVVATGDKTSFCLLDIAVYDGPGAPPAAPHRYETCGQGVQGISPGWADVYDRELEGQWIDVTGLPDASYWLEAEVDPEQRILEAPGGEDNNLARVQVWLGDPPRAAADRYEPNDSLAASTQLGPVRARLELTGLSAEAGADYYEFHLEQALPMGAHVSIASSYSSALQLHLLDPAGQYLRAADADLGLLSLAGLAAGHYYLRVAPYAEENPDYRLVLDPAANQAPQIEIVAPSGGTPWVEHAFEALPVRWLASDAENQPTTVALFIDRDENVDEGTLALGAYQNLAGQAGQASINTAAVGVGTWFLLARVSDGAAASESWASHPFFVYVKGDLDFDGEVDRSDWVLLVQRWRALGSVPFSQAVSGWERALDMDRDQDVDDADLALFRSAALSGPALGAAAH